MYFGMRMQFTAEEWDACARNSGSDPGNPFVTHGFLAALEHSKSAVPQRGWQPRHLALRDSDGKLCACVPLYAKSHSRGEYVFDHSWAHLYMRLGEEYYPKLQCCVPFTPVTGARVLVAPADDTEAVRSAVLRAMTQLPVAMSVRSPPYCHACPHRLPAERCRPV